MGVITLSGFSIVPSRSRANNLYMRRSPRLNSLHGIHSQWLGYIHKSPIGTTCFMAHQLEIAIPGKMNQDELFYIGLSSNHACLKCIHMSLAGGMHTAFTDGSLA